MGKTTNWAKRQHEIMKRLTRNQDTGSEKQYEFIPLHVCTSRGSVESRRQVRSPIRSVVSTARGAPRCCNVKPCGRMA
jgi:hypothetical protein